MRPGFTFASCLCLSTLAACSGSDELNCRDIGIVTCDIRSEGCQAQLFDNTRCLRGDTKQELKRPGVITLSESEARDLLLEEADEFELDETSIRAHTALALVGLVEPAELTADTQVEVTLEGLLGFYSSITNQIVVLELEQQPLDDLRANTTLAHEFVHALQHADFDIEKYRNVVEEGYDQQLAATTLLEGEATLYERFIEAKLSDISQDNVDWESFYDELTDAADDFTAEMPEPHSTAFAVFPYTYGGHSSYDIWDDRGRRGFAELRKQTAPSTLQDLARRHRRSAIDADTREVEPVSTPDGFEYVGHDRMGPWVLHGFLSFVMGEAQKPKLALGWRGDAFTVFVSDEDTGAIWKVVWDSSEQASQFAELIDAERSPTGGFWTARAKGTSASIYAATSAEALQALLGEQADSSQDLPTADDSSAPVGENALRQLLARYQHSCFRD